MTKRQSTLLDKLERIDAALLDGRAIPTQEKTGLQLVRLADAAPAMLKALKTALPLLEEYASAGDSATLRRTVRLMRKAARHAEHGNE